MSLLCDFQACYRLGESVGLPRMRRAAPRTALPLLFTSVSICTGCQGHDHTQDFKRQHTYFPSFRIRYTAFKIPDTFSLMTEFTETQTSPCRDELPCLFLQLCIHGWIWQGQHRVFTIHTNPSSPATGKQHEEVLDVVHKNISGKVNRKTYLP